MTQARSARDGMPVAGAPGLSQLLFHFYLPAYFA
jgi:hypothetical protein